MIPADRESVLFEEIQRFRQVWLWMLLSIPLLVVIPLFSFAIYQQFVLGRPFGNQPAGDTELIAGAVLALVVPLAGVWLFHAAKLTVTVRSASVTVRFFPFHRKARVIGADEILSAEPRDYDPINEYGGWGIRKGFRIDSGWAWNVSGSRGVQLTLRNGRRILIGSQRAEELADAIAAASSLHPISS